MQWNTFEVPLDRGWQCTLVPASEYRSPSGDWIQFIGDKDEKAQLEMDRRDFDRYFRPAWDLRTITGGQALCEIQTYVRDALNVARWNLPTDNESIERALRQAVTAGRLVPVVHRDRRSVLGRAYSPAPAPLRWPSSGGGGSFARATSWASYGAGSVFNGEPILSGPYDPGTQEARLIAARAATSGDSSSGGDGGNLLGMVGAVAGAVLGSVDTDAASADGSYLADAADTSALLGDALPFEYTPDAVSGATEELAGGERGSMYACDVISAECKGSVLREFPGQYLNSTLDEIQDDAQGGHQGCPEGAQAIKRWPIQEIGAVT